MSASGISRNGGFNTISIAEGQPWGGTVAELTIPPRGYHYDKLSEQISSFVAVSGRADCQQVLAGRICNRR